MKFKALFFALSLASVPLLATATPDSDSCNRNSMASVDSLQTPGPIVRNGIAKVAPTQTSGPSARNGIAKVDPTQSAGPPARNSIANVEHRQAYGPISRNAQSPLARINRQNLYASNIRGSSW